MEGRYFYDPTFFAFHCNDNELADMYVCQNNGVHNWLPCIEGLRASEVQDPFNNIIEVLTPLASSLINTYILPHIGSMCLEKPIPTEDHK